MLLLENTKGITICNIIREIKDETEVKIVIKNKSKV